MGLRSSRLAAASLLVCVALSSGSTAFAQSQGAAPAGGSAVHDLQASLLADPATRDALLGLQDDALVTQILNDQELMQAIHSGNLEQLMGNPKIRALSQHPTVKQIVEQQKR
jgi:hypothetical protein